MNTYTYACWYRESEALGCCYWRVLLADYVGNAPQWMTESLLRVACASAQRFARLTNINTLHWTTKCATNKTKILNKNAKWQSKLMKLDLQKKKRKREKGWRVNKKEESHQIEIESWQNGSKNVTSSYEGKLSLKIAHGDIFWIVFFCVCAFIFQFDGIRSILLAKPTRNSIQGKEMSNSPQIMNKLSANKIENEHENILLY